MNWDTIAAMRVDLLSLAGSAAILALYQLYMHFQIQRDPSYTFGSVMTYARAAWTENIMSGEPDVLPVQTFRNSTMVCVFLASTSVMLIMGVLNMSGQADKLSATWQLWSPTTSAAIAPKLFMFKLILLLVDLFVAFFSFAISLRFFNHVGYMINVPAALRSRIVPPESVAQQLNRAGRAYLVGMRSYYFLVPLVLWLFSPDLMLAASVVLVLVLYKVDRMPRAEGYLVPQVSESRAPVAMQPREATAVGLKAAA
jgi:uncharacterized membrane protein